MLVEYNAIDSDEVSVHVGEEVEIVSQTTEDEGWWKVRYLAISIRLLFAEMFKSEPVDALGSSTT